MNVKVTKTVSHAFYNSKQGRQGVALGGAERKSTIKYLGNLIMFLLFP